MASGRFTVSLVALTVAAGCSDASEQRSQGGAEAACKTNAECPAEAPMCSAGACVRPLAWALGWREGPNAVALTPVFEPTSSRQPTDLAFNPSKPTELWVVNRKDDSAIIIQDVGTPHMTFERRHDDAAAHFMDRPPALAFGVVDPEWGQTFGTCSDADNASNGQVDFVGPALFSADLDVYAKPTPGGLGSHLDMLHSTSFCRGIAHVRDNEYFVFNAQKSALDLYDFNDDHGPGADDHSDGEIFRFVEGSVRGSDDVPSHLVYDAAADALYVADTGNQRIARLDVSTAKVGSPFGGLEEVVARQRMSGGNFVDVVPPGTLEAPSGLELHEDLLYVTDHATSRFHAFQKGGTLVRTLETGLPPGSLAGFTFGPDGRIYFADLATSRIFRVDPL